jgi:hypothetical protein
MANFITKLINGDYSKEEEIALIKEMEKDDNNKIELEKFKSAQRIVEDALLYSKIEGISKAYHIKKKAKTKRYKILSIIGFSVVLLSSLIYYFFKQQQKLLILK